VAGPTTLTPAVVVGVVRYGESSRIVRLATRELGVQSAIARGALRPRSRFGTSLHLLAEGTAHLIPGRGDLATLAAFDVVNLHQGLARSVATFQAAAALAELAARFVPPIPQVEVYDSLVRGIALLEAAPPQAVEVIALVALWRFLAELGFSPETRRCVRDGRDIGEGELALSIEAGGALCETCAAGNPPVRLSVDDREALEFFLHGEGGAPELDERHAAAHRRLLARWVARHLGEAEMPALRVWQRGL
jgi:DNA repair protein RecO (recombination protein O)